MIVMDDREEPEDLLNLLFILAWDDGDLEDDELLVLFRVVEIAARRGLLVGPQEIPMRLHASSLDDETCLRRFRFTRRQLNLLYDALKIPDSFTDVSRTRWSGMDGLLVLLRRLSYPNRLGDLVEEFGRSKPVLSLIFNTMLAWIWQHWSHLITDAFNSPYFTPGRKDSYCRAIKNRSSVDLAIWGFIDGTVRPICRPGHHQRVVYNGHKRTHALKYQIVTTPDGLISHMYGPVEGRRHDAGVFGESGLLPQLQQHMNGAAGNPYALFGDSAYPLSPYLQKGFQGANLLPHQLLFNSRMSAVRQAVEWAFGQVVNEWAYVDMRKQQKILLQPIGVQYKVAVLLANARTILRAGNKTSKYFDLQPPSLEEYFQP